MPASPANKHQQEVVDAINVLWRKGKSARDIGDEVELSKNAVIGIVNRYREIEGEMKWARRQTARNFRVGPKLPRAPRRAPKPKAKASAPKKRKPALVASPSPTKPKLLSWEDWMDRQGNGDRSLCGFVEGDPLDGSLTCCSGKVDYESVWCDYHKPIATLPPKKKRDDYRFRLPRIGVGA